MSKVNKQFQTAEVPIPDRSGFDLSREHILTTMCGTLTPVECFEVLPNDTISMGAMHKVTLPPFAVPFMGRIDACLEAFFVPYRILFKGWQSFITQNFGVQSNPSGTGVPNSVPLIDCSSAANLNYLASGTLADYLGLRQSASTTRSVSAMKFLAYHKICDEWYRDQNNVKPFFAKNPGMSTATTSSLNQYMPHFVDSINTTNNTLALTLAPTSGVADVWKERFDATIGLGDLRQRSWAKDYFTTMTTRPQAGDAAEIRFSTSGSTSAITVSDIRVASSLQRWLERNGIAGTDYGAQILAHFGVTPPDAVMNKPVLLGAMRDSVYINAVEQNTQTDNTAVPSKNPFNGELGSNAGNGSSFGKGSLIPEFHVKEHGCIMVLFSLVPHAYYNSGIDREMLHIGVGDFAWPEYAHIGDQQVFAEELYQDAPSSTTIGYNQRYSEYKFRPDKISGIVRDGDTLGVYALQRGFSSIPQLGKDFLEIPKNYLDKVLSTETYAAEFSCMVDAYFDTKAIRLLPEYSLPSLK